LKKSNSWFNLGTNTAFEGKCNFRIYVLSGSAEAQVIYMA